MSRVIPIEQQRAARDVKKWLAHHEQQRDLVLMGAYKEGLDPVLDLALAVEDRLRAFLVQDADVASSLGDTQRQLLALHQSAAP